MKRPDGTEYTLIRPSVANTYNSIVENMADVYGYMHPVYENGTSKVKITLRSEDGTIAAGGRFRYIDKEIDSDYQSLVDALNRAIDAEAAINSNYITDEKSVVPASKELDFDALMSEFTQTIDLIINNHSVDEFKSNYSPKIVQITERYLGKGKKVSQCTRDQVEMLSLIVTEIKELI